MPDNTEKIQAAVAFLNWFLSDECQYVQMEENTFVHSDTNQVVSTEQLFDIFILNTDDSHE